MARVFAWKINTGKYAYLVKENGSYIQNRITDKDKLIRMSNTVRGYDIYEYENAFDELKEEVASKYGFNLGSADMYFDDGSSDSIQLILLTGKDGDNYNDSAQSTVLTENDYNNISNIMGVAMDRLDGKLLEARNELHAEAVSYSSQAISITQSAIASLTDKVNNVESQITEISPASRYDDFSGPLSKGAPSDYNISTSDTGITLSYSTGTSVTVVGDEISLMSGDFGLKITPTGIKIIRKGEEKDL